MIIQMDIKHMDLNLMVLDDIMSLLSNFSLPNNHFVLWYPYTPQVLPLLDPSFIQEVLIKVQNHYWQSNYSYPFIQES